ncbi:Carcinine transporter-like 3 [Homarus americanus]|uniref:Carcinine transporter-like 3 n=1 Tax=Homarus americanus TaxID=6706 RepID=A0A8J5JHH8_HOMAM|nr:Carcinine transporter-like 3 [Homarus americanus]
MAKDFDEILETVGSYGYYQKWLVYVLLIPATFFSAFTMNLMLFQVVVPDHWCYVPGRENTTLSPEEWRALTLPRAIESEKYSSCLMYKGEWSEDDGANYTVTNETQECISGWQHDPSQFTKTLSTELEWVCEREIYSQHVLSFTMAGNTVGTFLLPILADRYVGGGPARPSCTGHHAVIYLMDVWDVLHRIGTYRSRHGGCYLKVGWDNVWTFSSRVNNVVLMWSANSMGDTTKYSSRECIQQMARENGKEETSRTHLETGRLIEGLWKGPFGS